jgi:hypothetical protein
VKLERLHITELGPFGQVELPFVGPDGDPRMVTVIYGDGGTGKSTVHAAIECTRPGHVSRGQLFRDAPKIASIAAAWRLDSEDPERPHPLWIGSPGQPVHSDEAEERLRRSEQSFFERQAARGSGFIFLEFSEHRSFPRVGVSLSDLARTMMRKEGRNPGYSDRSRHELTRKVKQVMAFAELSAAQLGGAQFDGPDPRRLRSAIHMAMACILPLVGIRYEGIDPLSFEPLFETADGRLCHFDELAKQARHVIAFGALTAHALWAGSGGEDPHQVPGVVCIDEVEIHLQDRVVSGVIDALTDAFRQVQWVITTSSSLVAACVDSNNLLALRRLPGQVEVQLYVEELAQTH